MIFFKNKSKVLKRHANTKFTSFFQTGVFRWITFLAGSLILLSVTGLTFEDYGGFPVLDLSKDGFKFFLELYDFPFLIIKTYIPLITIIGFNFNSEQKSIEASYNRFIAHRKSFVEYCASAALEKGLYKVEDPYLLYQKYILMQLKEILRVIVKASWNMFSKACNT